MHNPSPPSIICMRSGLVLVIPTVGSANRIEAAKTMLSLRGKSAADLEQGVAFDGASTAADGFEDGVLQSHDTLTARAGKELSV